MPINVWDYLREYDELRDEILAAVDRVFRSGRLVLGQEGIKFEREMAGYLGVAGGVGVNSGTDAIYIALASLGVKAGDEVITVPNTAVPTVSAIRTLGATPVFVDVREEDFLMDVGQVEAAITPRTKAIVPVHLYGQCVDLDPLMAIAERHGLKVMEDCAQSQGALYKNHQSGSVGHASAFSFYPTKVLGAYGDGGMVLSNDEAALKLARSLRFYGMETQYYSERHGYNSRLDEVQAAILSLKLPRIEGWIERRREIAARYDRGLAGSGLVLPRQNAHSRHSTMSMWWSTRPTATVCWSGWPSAISIATCRTAGRSTPCAAAPISAIARGSFRWRSARRSASSRCRCIRI
jgi:aminotransferase EvaB